MAKQTYLVDDGRLRFSAERFSHAVHEEAARLQVSVRATERRLADALCVSPATVHAWLCGVNAPGELALVLGAEKLLGLSPGALLEEPRGGMPSVDEYTKDQRGALRRVYWGFIDFIREYELTDGFSDWWLEFADQGVPGKLREERILQRAEERQERLATLLMREGFDLEGTPAWEPLWDLLWGDLGDMWDGKCGNAYWFECLASSRHEEAVKVMARLDEIVGIADSGADGDAR